MSDEDNNPEDKFLSVTSAIQMGYGAWVSLINIVIGLALGWPSSALPQMIADPSFDVKTSDEAWIASILALVAPIGCLVGGYIIDLIGRKYALVIGGVPFALGWIVTGFSKSSTHVIIGRVVTGVGLGMGLGTPRVYITEISLPNMRGVIAVFTTLAMSIGLTLQALLGASFKWQTLCFTYGILSALIGGSCFFLPETPYYVLLKSNQGDAADKALRRFRGKNYDIQAELIEMIDFKMSNDIKKISLRAQMKLLGTRSACLPFWIMVAYVLATQLSGASILFVWTIDFLQASNSSVAPATAHLSMEFARLVFGVVSAVLMYTIGRRPQALMSSIGVAVVCLVLGSFLIYYTESSSPLPFVCYLLYVTFSTLGYYTLPFMMMYELYPLQYWVDFKAKLKKRVAAVRASQTRTGGGPSTEQPLSEIETKFLSILGENFGQGLPGVRVEPFAQITERATLSVEPFVQLRGLLGGITNGVIDVMIFAANATYPFTRDLIGHAYIIIAFGVFSCLATVFLFFCLPETKGLTLQEIEEYYNERRPTLVSQRSVIAAQKSRLLLKSGSLPSSLLATMADAKQKTTSPDRKSLPKFDSNSPNTSK